MTAQTIRFEVSTDWDPDIKKYVSTVTGYVGNPGYYTSHAAAVELYRETYDRHHGRSRLHLDAYTTHTFLQKLAKTLAETD